MDIAGTAALVTGGASGPRAATARELARLGARVAVLDRNAEGAKAVAAEIGANGSVGLGCDICDTASVIAALGRPRRPRPGAPADERGRHRQRQAHRRQGRLARAAGRLRARGARQPDRHLQHHAPRGGRNGQARAAGRWRARRDRQHRLGGGLRQPGRPGSVFGQQRAASSA